MNKKLVIFDLDGTLLDTSADLADSMNGMLSFFGYPNITREQAKRYIGNGARNFVLRSLPEDAADRVDECLKKYNEIYNSSGSPKTALYDGVAEVLHFLKEKNTLTAIASNKPQPSTDEVYAKYLKKFNFDFVYGNRPGFAHKPDRACGEYILKELNVLARNAVVVGDGETDVVFSKNLGCGIVAVTWGYRSKKVLENTGAEIFAETSFELRNVLEKFINEP
ncbi:MAG: HAD family hydrolase [Clostridia bacterium]|nr:HAD family hydrolase [Clostridia bacterium]